MVVVLVLVFEFVLWFMLCLELGCCFVQLLVECIVLLFVVVCEGQLFSGLDFIVVVEKVGLDFGDMGIYYCLIDGKCELGLIFSVVNMFKLGNFDLGCFEVLCMLGVSFFMILFVFIFVFDVWDVMLFIVQCMVELFDGYVLDEECNVFGCQCIVYICDELCGWDCDYEGQEIIFGC